MTTTAPKTPAQNTPAQNTPAQNTPPGKTEALNALEDALDSDFLKALSEPARVDIVKLLIAGDTLDVGEIATQLPQERSVISRHLKILRDAGLVRVERAGRRRMYTLVPGAFVTKLERILQTTRACISVCCPTELPAAPNPN